MAQETNVGEALARLEERTTHILSNMHQLVNKLDSSFVTQTEFKVLKTAVESLDVEVEKTYVTKDEFTPVKTAVYGMIGVMLTSVIIALIALVVKT